MLDQTRNRVQSRLTELSDFVSRVKVSASLLANFIYHKCMEEGVSLDANQEFYMACLACYRAERKRPVGPLPRIQSRFEDLRTLSGLGVVPGDNSGTNQVFVYQAALMATDASNAVEVNFGKRVKTLLSWGLRVRIRPLFQQITDKQFKDRLAALTAFVADASDTARLLPKLRELGFESCIDSIAELCEAVTSFRDTSVSAKRRHLLNLQQRFLSEDRRQYDAIVEEAFRLHPGKDGSALRGEFITQRWTHDTPPNIMTPLPCCRAGARFVRVDKKAMRALFPDLEDRMQGPWWYRAFMNPFLKRAGITQLQGPACRFSRSEAGFMEAMRFGSRKNLRCPWLVGPSFLTDGRQIKIELLTSKDARPACPGLSKLRDAGYRVSFESVPLEDVLSRGDGVYRLEHINAPSLDAYNGVKVTSIDPGQVHVIDGAVADGSAWRMENVVRLVRGEVEEVVVTGDEYRENAKTLLAQGKEPARRDGNVDYGAAQMALRAERKRTCDSAEFVRYCRCWAERQGAIWGEVLHEKRRIHAFSRFRAVQSAVARIAEKVAPMRDKGKVRRIVFFGAATFKPCKGCASAPFKRVVHQIACRAPTAMVPEGGTSKYCSGCGRELIKGEGYRTRACITNPADCPLHEDGEEIVTFGRDTIGRTGIGMRGVYESAGVSYVVPGFRRYRARAAQPEADTDSESDDDE